jgi:hypothetical protein
MRDITSEIASKWELQHRKPAQDSRRLEFKKHIELLQMNPGHKDTLFLMIIFEISRGLVDFYGVSNFL